MNQHTIKIKGIRVYAFHGCLEEEGRVGQEYEVNLNFELNFEEAAQNDDLTKTIDYVTVYEIVLQEMAVRSKLIETVAKRIHQRAVEAFPMATRIEVEVLKFGPPVGGIMGSAAVVYS
jgi:dihydroneopterin aldolase